MLKELDTNSDFIKKISRIRFNFSEEEKDVIVEKKASCLVIGPFVLNVQKI